MDLITLHLISLIITAPAILYADHIGFQYMTGRIEVVSAKKVTFVHRLVMVGLALLIVTGVLVTIPLWTEMLQNPLFYTKLASVATLALNGIFIGRLMKKASLTAFANLSKDEKRFLIVSGVISAVGWITSILIGFFGL